jgi:VanZ family protein
LTAILVVIIGSLLPSDTAPIQALNSLGINDKVMHFLAYAIIAVLPAIHERPVFSIFAGVAAVALGVALEYGQLYSPGRSFEVADMAADALGVSLGLLVGIPFHARIARLATDPGWRRVFGGNSHFTRHEIQRFQTH